ncbi:MAG TPA: plastocyanin/azurin family copper-binding protein [Mycobacteriales bacterium]|jgi:uncharacterized cupredoxin-like copper-binding protein
MTKGIAAAAAAVLLAACAGSEGATESGGAAARTVEVKALGTLRFDPATVAAKAGERVAFRVTNTDGQDHEFVVGDAAFHEGHEAAANGGMRHDGHDVKGDGAAVTLKPGETKTVEYTMPATAPRYACHLVGHDDAGMTGTVTY